MARGKIALWKHAVDKLTDVSSQYPQAAYTCLTNSLQQEWTYVQRIMKIKKNTFVDLDNKIDTMIEELFDQTPPDRELTSFPVKAGGLGIPIPSKQGEVNFNASVIGTSELINAIKNKKQLNLVTYKKTDEVNETKHCIRKNNTERQMLKNR